MKKNSASIFVVPPGTHKHLGEYGWEFDSNQRLSGALGDHLVKALALEFQEEYLGIKKYTGIDIIMSIFFDDLGKIESIYLQVGAESLTTAKDVLRNVVGADKAEMFIPKEHL